MERMELKNVRTDADDDSADSLADPYTEPSSSEKTAISR